MAVYEKIIQWVTAHGDAEFQLVDRDLSTSDISLPQVSAPMIYSTKEKGLRSRLEFEGAPTTNSLIGTYGIPVGGLRKWIRSVSATSRIYFLGDLDSIDLMAYASLVDGLESDRIEYFGISDSLLNKFSVSLSSLQRCFISASPAENKALEALSSIGVDVERLVGQQCFSLLQAGQKIEVEGLLWDIPVRSLIDSATTLT